MTDALPPTELESQAGADSRTTSSKPENASGKANLGPLALFIGVSVVVLAAAAWYLVRPEPLLLQGVVDSVHMDVAARITGRAAAPVVRRGQDVAAGAVVARVENPELLAQLETARAAQAVAEAELARIHAGTRQEIIDQRKADIASAEANRDLAQSTYDRTKQLAQNGFATQARLDQATDALIVASHTLEQARLAYNQAVAGYTKEDVQIAEAKVEKAKADVASLQAQVNELTIVAPVASQVFRIDVEHGEFVLNGVPLLSLVDLSDPYIVFNLREDLMSGLKIGDKMTVQIPALKRPIEVEARLIAPRGEYAGWRSTRATGDFDLRTFEVRFYPTVRVEGLRPGMSAYMEWPGR